MGKVPVAPRRKRLLPEGDRKVKGFADKPRDDGFNKMEKM
jgi:hypothetical protein